MMVEPGSIKRHVCGSTGYERTARNVTLDRNRGTIVEDFKEIVKAALIEVVEDCGVTNKANNNMLLDLAGKVTSIDTNTKDIVKALEIKGKLDYRKDGNAETIEDQFKQNSKDITGLYDLFGKFTGYVEAFLMKDGFPSAADYMKKQQEQSQLA